MRRGGRVDIQKGQGSEISIKNIESGAGAVETSDRNLLGFDVPRIG